MGIIKLSLQFVRCKAAKALDLFVNNPRCIKFHQYKDDLNKSRDMNRLEREQSFARWQEHCIQKRRVFVSRISTVGSIVVQRTLSVDIGILTGTLACGLAFSSESNRQAEFLVISERDSCKAEVEKEWRAETRAYRQQLLLALMKQKEGKKGPAETSASKTPADDKAEPIQPKKSGADGKNAIPHPAKKAGKSDKSKQETSVDGRVKSKKGPAETSASETPADDKAEPIQPQKSGADGGHGAKKAKSKQETP